MGMEASEKINKYFEILECDVSHFYSKATLARKKGFDPENFVEVKLAKNLAERVVGLISVVAPQIEGSGVVERIVALEEQYGALDWRVGMIIAHEVAEQKYCQFKNKLEAIEIGIRVGFAYTTLGVVSSPIEGFTGIELKRRRDGKEYFAMRFAGPIRNAGGTNAAVSVLIADYVRKKLGYAVYDPDEREQERTYTEIMDYHTYVTNLQYVPSKEESLFMAKCCPIEIDGDPSEKYEVSNFKDLPRVATNRIRSGYCLIHSSCLPLKAPKLWKKLSQWLNDMDMQDWAFMEEFLNIQKKAKSKSSSSDSGSKETKTKEQEHIYPIYTYITDLVGGRPVIGHPIRPGGLRLRYGRSRVSGFSAQSIHPATMFVLDDFIAIGTQLKVERPGKAAAFTSCDAIMGPIVELHSGELIYLGSVEKAKKYKSQVKIVHHLGDVLINYGDFFDRAQTLLPPGYCEEWWALELAEKTDLPDHIKENKISHTVTPIEAFEYSRKYGVSLHPQVTLFWKLLNAEEFNFVVSTLSRSRVVQNEKIIVPFCEKCKSYFNRLGLEHKVINKEFLIIESFWTQVLTLLFNTHDLSTLPKQITCMTGLDGINQLTEFNVKDKSGMYIGARMGRPEKAKMRKMAGQPWSVKPQQIRIKLEDGTETTQTVTEHNMKAQLREKYQINSNKDGTIRYDASEVPITHFKPKEARASIEKLHSLGYTHDIHGKPLENDSQILELFPQDIIIPCCTESPFEPADEVMFRVAQFVDDLLITLYKEDPVYNLKSKSDLVGQYVFGLAPHTSAASICRIVGFTPSQGIYCHPLMHAAMRRDCDGDETCFFLLMDGLLNFSTKFLPQHRGGTMDAPLVLTSLLNPKEVDDMAFNMDVVWEYPVEFYKACEEFKKPWDVKIELFEKRLGTPGQFEGIGFTHDSTNFNDGVQCSAYKLLPSMKEKVDGQMNLARKIYAVDEKDVAQIVIDKHFLRDTMGNLRKFSTQEFRCVKCNTKYRRPPLRGKCETCGAKKIIFTISKGSVIKYLQLSKNLAEEFNISDYTKEVLQVLQYRVDGVFGKELEQQTGLNQFFG